MRHQLSTNQNASGTGGASRRSPGSWLPRRTSRVRQDSPSRMESLPGPGRVVRGRRLDEYLELGHYRNPYRSRQESLRGAVLRRAVLGCQVVKTG